MKPATPETELPPSTQLRKAVFGGSPETNRLYHNNGDGTFSRVSLGSLASDSANSHSCAWGDYDNDGYMDLYVSNGPWGGLGPQAGFLYRNNGSSNRWLKLKLVGTVSNRAAIGAQVRVKATLGGKTFWQLRQVPAGGGFHCQDDLRPHFGLGDATRAEIVRIEWPSGSVQEFHNVPANQILTVTEPARLQVTGQGQFQIRSWTGQKFHVEASTDLAEWTPLATVTNLTGVAQSSDTDAANLPRRFYRVVAE